MLVVLFLTIFIVTIDQVSKYLVIDALIPGESIIIIPRFLYFTFVQNTGVAFGLFRDNPLAAQSLVLIGCTVGMIILCAIKKMSMIDRVACACMIGGAIGNLIDRILYGAVIDFIDLRVWPIFNVADMCISIAAGLLIISMIRK